MSNGHKVMNRFKRGELRSSSGAPVRSRGEARGIALAEGARARTGFANGGVVEPYSAAARAKFSRQAKGKS